MSSGKNEVVPTRWYPHEESEMDSVPGAERAGNAETAGHSLGRGPG